MRLKIVCADKVGVAQEVFKIFGDHNLNISGIDFNLVGAPIFIQTSDIEFDELREIMSELRMIAGVEDVLLTSCMPSERKISELKILAKSLTVPYISIDKDALILSAQGLSMAGEIDGGWVGRPISDVVSGLDFVTWLNSEAKKPERRKLIISQFAFEAQLEPVYLQNENGQGELSGLIIILKEMVGSVATKLSVVDSNVYRFPSITRKSSVMKRTVREAKIFALTEAPILISGEPGSGKDLIATACHYHTREFSGEFVKLRAAELNGADGKQRLLKALEDAVGGTLYLDEINEMSPIAQSNLLIELNKFMSEYRADGSQPKFRLICSTTCSIRDGMSGNTSISKELFNKLAVQPITVPPLCERKKDIPEIINSLIAKLAEKLLLMNVKVSPKSLSLLVSYPWPGNIRQMENVLFNALSLSESNTIEPCHIKLPYFTEENGFLANNQEKSLIEIMDNYEKNILTELYPAFPSTRLLAKRLGMSHTAVANKLKRYGLGKRAV